MTLFSQTHGVETLLDKRMADVLFNQVMDNVGTPDTEDACEELKALNNQVYTTTMPRGAEG